MNAKQFILLNLEHSICEYGESLVLIISIEDLVTVGLSGQCDPVPVLVVTLGFKLPKQFGVRFDATNHLLDGMRFYRSIVEQLGIDINFDIEAQIPSELRHLLPTQPEIVNRP